MCIHFVQTRFFYVPSSKQLWWLFWGNNDDVQCSPHFTIAYTLQTRLQLHMKMYALSWWIMGIANTVASNNGPIIKSEQTKLNSSNDYSNNSNNSNHTIIPPSHWERCRVEVAVMKGYTLFWSASTQYTSILYRDTVRWSSRINWTKSTYLPTWN